jgi:hypothetical protein
MYKISISSPPDRDQLVADIMVDNVQFAELNNEAGMHNIEIYERPDHQPWKIPFSILIEMLAEAKNKLEKIKI